MRKIGQKKILTKTEYQYRLVSAGDYIIVRGCKGFDRLKENGEAIRMQCVKWQIKNKR